MSRRGNLLYLVDVMILIAFVLSGVSGLALWLGGPGGYQGGRNPHYGQLILGLSKGAWSDLHLWTSLAMGAGVFLHLALHWPWVVCMTKRWLGSSTRPRRATSGADIGKLEA